MSSPCGSCYSFPCACPKVTIDEGRYSYQTYDHCNICFKTPCVCSTMSDFNNWVSGDAYCIGCSNKPCICPGTIQPNDKSCCGEMEDWMPSESCPQCEKYKQIIKMLLEDY